MFINRLSILYEYLIEYDIGVEINKVELCVLKL